MISNYEKQYTSQDMTITVNDTETYIKTKDVKALQYKAILAHHKISKTRPDPILQILRKLEISYRHLYRLV